MKGVRPFLTGLVDEAKQKQPGMMTLIAVAITVAWGYSAATTLGVEGSTFFWAGHFDRHHAAGPSTPSS